MRVPGLPAPLSHYTDAVRFGDILFVSGLTPLDENAQLIGKDDVVAQARQVHLNLETTLTYAGVSFADVLKVTVFFSLRCTNHPHPGRMPTCSGHGQNTLDLPASAALVQPPRSVLCRRWAFVSAHRTRGGEPSDGESTPSEHTAGRGEAKGRR